MPLPAPDFERLFAPGTRHTLPGGDVATVRLRRDASLWLPSGRVVAGEPFMFDAMDGGFVQRVPPGRYPLELVLAVFGEPDDPAAYDMIAAARLVIRDEPVVSWEMAVYEGQDVSTLGDDEFFGYPVDGGTGGFVDAASIAALCEDGEDYLDRVMASLHARDTDPTAPGTLTDEEGRPRLVVFSSGDGDGHYPTWVGRTADGEVACFITDFFILTDDEDDEAGEDDKTPPGDRAGHALSDFAQGHEMRAGQTLRRQSLTSPAGRYTLVHQDDGNIVLYDNVRLHPWWASGTDGAYGSYCVLRASDGLALLGSDGRRIWCTGARGPAARLVVRDDGDIAIEDAAGAEVWSSGTAEVTVPAGPAAIGDRMLPGQTLGRQSLTSPSGRHTLVHQDDGNIVLYDNEGRGAVWASGTDGRETACCVLQADGDLILYDRRGRVVWSTGTAGHPGSVLTVSDDGVELRAPDGTVPWRVRTTPGTPATPLRRADTTVALSPVKTSPARPLSEGRPLSRMQQSLSSAAIPARPAVKASPKSAAAPADESGHVDPSDDVHPGKV
ncbi:DUF4241 domain-containing protein [Actinoallomurus soli]|uniref:DUF4241 domain-containing protein n=1 Tax=Actinoallomurus soli TaxID=2952535 RepID=UPI0020920B94|nr:DUF4241 domain-containing protein [Actinoallomurus soli]MCO5967416.1 DUF4241 domain-containing protein [Actinoallomurus soli]